MIRIIEFSRRMGAVSDAGCPYAVEYIVEGKSETELMWLDEFVAEHCEGVKVGEI